MNAPDSGSAVAMPAVGAISVDAHGHLQASTRVLTLAALGVVFGDIGTSPLYTFKTVLTLGGGVAEPGIILGSLSLLVWTLIVITSIKYVSFAMRVDNDGEGGILALMSLLGLKAGKRPLIVAAGLFGAALIYGDGAITPAISVLSAVEGIGIAAPAFEHYVLPTAVLILIGLFAIQPQGTHRIGRAFGPIMMLWFAVIGALGLWGIVRHPGVLVALDPRFGLRYLAEGGGTGFEVLGGVFLCVTGAEALYADMGHFGARPIRLGWYALVFPSLLLNYAGQAALVLSGAPTGDNIFYRLCPPVLVIPLVVLATAATIIASQAIITGAFSMTRQAIQIGWLPRMQITQTCAEGYGQIYVGPVNWLLMAATLALAVGFGKSDNLASAYGIAVSATMLITAVLLGIAMREIWRWSFATSALVAGAFVLVDSLFFAANLQKVAEGGYVPLVLASLIYGAMLIWNVGKREVASRMQESSMPMATLLDKLEQEHIARVPGTAVFLTRTQNDAPPVMVWHLRHNRALHEKLFIVTLRSVSVPWVEDPIRLTVEATSPGIWRATARYGFMERPDLPALLKQARERGCAVDAEDVTYYLGHETIVVGDNNHGLTKFLKSVFAFMQRNSLHASEYFRLPPDSVVEIGREMAI